MATQKITTKTVANETRSDTYVLVTQTEGGVHSLRRVPLDVILAGVSAAEFDSTATYAAGDFCLYQGKMYKFTDDHTGAWDADDVEQANAGETLAAVIAALDSKAEIDGLYEQMTVGNAEQLVSGIGVTDKVPYNFRTSGGSADIGDRETDMVVGGTLAWNQLVKNGNFEGTTDWATSNVTLSASDNVMTATKAAGTAFGTGYASQRVNLIQGHKYFMTCDYKNESNTTMIRLFHSSADIMISDQNWHTRTYFFDKTTASGNAQMMIWNRSVNTTEDMVLKVRNYMIFDLTAMFGSTIADYIYTLEQSTAGAGVAWFRKLFPKPYYAYNPGELMSVQAAAHKMVGFNAWDEEWELGGYNINTGGKTGVSDRIRSKNFIRVIPGTTYCIRADAGGGAVLFYDYNKGFISASIVTWSATGGATFTTPDSCYYVTFGGYANYGTTYNHDICINLSWDGERNGEYEPYIKHTYPLDDSLTLRGIPKLDADNRLYYDGDTYESDGTVTRKYGVVDLGTLEWGLSTSYGYNLFYTGSLAGLINSANENNFICGRYSPTTNGWDTMPDDSIRKMADATRLNIHDDSYTTAADFKAAMSGVMLVYELAEPTTETADPYQSPQIVDDFGTEEYVDAAVAAETRDVAIPVGHTTTYQVNLRAKLEMAPNSPEGDGDYLVRQTNGQNVYVPLTFPADELPAAPTEDGNYVLKCTIADGAATYSWEEEA